MDALSLADARETLARVFKYPAFRPGQSAAVLSVIRGRDTVVILPTGGGKSLCYQVPAVMLEGLTIIVSPLISLMRDQVRALEKKGVAAAFLNSALTQGESSDVLARAERGELKMLYLAPERFESGEIAARLKKRVILLAIDEAHCISQWGHDFRPSYRRLAGVRRGLGWPPTIALTATATPDVRADIAEQLALRKPTVIVTGFDRANLGYSVLPAKTDSAKTPLILKAVSSTPGSSIVYAATKGSVDRIAATLSAAGIQSGAYHAGLDSDRRKKIQDAFMSGSLRTIVATNAFGMGIDKPDVRLVVHHSMPGTLEAYYQEAGRAGRDGRMSNVLLLHSYADRFTHEFFISNANPDRKVIEAAYLALKSNAVGGVFAGTAEKIPLPSKRKITSRQIEGAVRILVRGGALESIASHPTKVCVRLTATPDRITRELGGAESMELGLLRALWRSSGRALQAGAELDLNALPPGLNGPAIVTPLLDALEARQIIHWRRVGDGLRLLRPRASLEAFDIDWHALENRRKGEVAKLDAMQQYAYARNCRRAFFLRYFGEIPRSRKCASCDNCGRAATIL
jgi:ATP-dependent DNA helicase RecQ